MLTGGGHLLTGGGHLGSRSVGTDMGDGVVLMWCHCTLSVFFQVQVGVM